MSFPHTPELSQCLLLPPLSYLVYAIIAGVRVAIEFRERLRRVLVISSSNNPLKFRKKVNPIKSYELALFHSNWMGQNGVVCLPLSRKGKGGAECRDFYGPTWNGSQSFRWFLHSKMRIKEMCLITVYYISGISGRGKENGGKLIASRVWVNWGVVAWKAWEPHC